MIPKRRSRVGDRTAEVLKKSGDEIGILAVIMILRNREYDALDTPEAQMIVEAIKRSTNEVDPGDDISEVADYVDGISDAGMPGFINNVKGIYHEMEFVEAENSDGDSVIARLHEDVNHPGSDVILTDTNTGEVVEVQLKATGDPDLVEKALEKYPDIEVYVTSEVAEVMKADPRVNDSGFSNNEITGNVETEIRHLQAANAGPLDYIPHAALWSTCLASAPVIRDWWRGNITREECTRKVAKITGLKVAKVAGILALLAFPPTSAPTSIYLVARFCFEVFKAYTR